MKKLSVLIFGMFLLTSILVSATYPTWTYCKINEPDICGTDQECLALRTEILNYACNLDESLCSFPCLYIPLDACVLQLPNGQPLGTPYDNETCEDAPHVPEFSGIAAGLALAGAAVGFMVLRKRR